MVEIIAKDPFYRVISGGLQKEFPIDEENKMLRYVKERLETFSHVAVRRLYVLEKIQK